MDWTGISIVLLFMGTLATCVSIAMRRANERARAAGDLSSFADDPPRPAAPPARADLRPVSLPPAAAPAPNVARARFDAALAALPATAPARLQVARADALPFLLDGAGRWHSLSLHAAQHYAICGASRSGKGNLLQYLVLSALSLAPEAAQVWVIDAKNGLDYAFCTQLAHARLYADVPEADGTLTAGLEAAKTEMERRNKLLFGVARNVREYNARAAHPLPIILLVVDEVAELTPAQHALLASLARMAAGAGFVICVATQYPTVDALPSQIQANMLNRVCFRLSSSRYTPVALALGAGERPVYEPAAINAPGVAVLRRDGGVETLGRVPEVSDQVRDAHLARLVAQHPRTEIITPTADAPPAIAAPAVFAWTPEHLKVAAAISANPQIGKRALARVLYPDTDGGGDYAKRADRLRCEVEGVLGVKCEVLEGTVMPSNTDFEDAITV